LNKVFDQNKILNSIISLQGGKFRLLTQKGAVIPATGSLSTVGAEWDTGGEKKISGGNFKKNWFVLKDVPDSKNIGAEPFLLCKFY